MIQATPRRAPTHAADGCECLASQIVGRRSQSASRYDDVDPSHGRLECRDVVGEGVADSRVVGDVDAALDEPFGEPLAVGVEPLAARQFVANGR